MTLCWNAMLTSALPAQTVASVAARGGSTGAAGLGGSGAASVGDAGALFANPAALATVHRLAVEASYESYPGGTTLATGALALRVGAWDWGAGVAALGQSYTAADVLAVSTLVLRTGVVALGGSAKYARETAAAARGGGWAGGLGLATPLFELLAFRV